MAGSFRGRGRKKSLAKHQEVAVSINSGVLLARVLLLRAMRFGVVLGALIPSTALAVVEVTYSPP